MMEYVSAVSLASFSSVTLHVLDNATTEIRSHSPFPADAEAAWQQAMTSQSLIEQLELNGEHDNLHLMFAHPLARRS